MITKGGSILDLGSFSVKLTRSNNLGHLDVLQNKINGQSRHVALFRGEHFVMRMY